MQFPSFTIQGNIVSSEILTKIREEDIRHQDARSFGLDAKTTLRDEIGIAWAATRAHYTAFRLRVNRLKDDDPGTSETRNSWMIPLLRELGYDIEKARAYTLADSGKSYAISHKAVNRGDFAVHIMGINDSLDKRRESGGPRLSPHGLVQEFLNNTEHDYALVTNGRYLRLLRDATRLVRLSYLEVDLEKMMEEELYIDFALLFRLLHASRMPALPDETTDSPIEYYHQESLSSGSRIREKLSVAVKQSILQLANGFLHHTANEDFTGKVAQGTIAPADYYLYQLRVIYRFLFLIVTEERNLVYPDTKDPVVQRLRGIYYDYYSIERLRRLAYKSLYIDGRKTDLWEGLKTTFELFEDGRYGQKLGIKPLGSGLFGRNALGELPNLTLSNEVLLRVIRNLTLFENNDGQLVRVNYSDLDVEEFGSVYEGLLEFDAVFKTVGNRPTFAFVDGTGRSSSGSHYTPEELVKPLITHSLDYLIADRLKAPNPEQALLSLKIADVACGSGHILLSAARRVAIELARVRTHEEQPAPTAIRQALRDVIKQCIYGVDKNPLAVELCKVALWLEAHNPGEPLNFLDHRIKCGDALVGLAQAQDLQRGIATEAFKALPDDDKGVAKLFRDRNKRERATQNQLPLNYNQTIGNDLTALMQAYTAFDALPERTPDEIATKQQAYARLLGGRNHQRLKTLADLQLMPFFVAKTDLNQSNLLTDATYRRYLRGEASPTDAEETKAITTAATQRFFHWFLEFPEVFTQGGFDCVLGNPPFLGGLKLSTNYGQNYLTYLHHAYAPAGGTCDLVAYFFRRIFSLNQKGGFLSLISTNTIAQGDTRTGGLEKIVTDGGTINHAVRSMRWPGLAAVEVALVTIHKGEWKSTFTLDQKPVQTITPYLDSAETMGNPYPLEQNKGKSFIGSYVLGMGFIMAPQQAEALIAKDPKNKDVLFPYLNGDDLNSNPDQSPSRWVINFFDWPLRRYTADEWNGLDKDERKKIRNDLKKKKFVGITPPDYTDAVAADYPDCLVIVERDVKPERLANRDNVARERWWLFMRLRKELLQSIQGKNKVMAISLTGKNVAFSFVSTDTVFSHAVGIIVHNDYSSFSMVHSSLNNEWARKYASSLETRIRYTPSDCFDPYPLPQNINQEKQEKLENIGQRYYQYRSQIMLGLQLSLTKTYNLFHSQELQPLPDDTLRELSKVEEKQLTKQVGKEGIYLFKHLHRTREATLSFNEAVRQIAELRRLHVEMDTAVLEAYGWATASEDGPAISLRHDFYEVDYLPENDRVRYTIHPEARAEVLKRLLALNHRLYAEEQEAKKAGKKPTKSKALSAPATTTLGAPQMAAEEIAAYHSPKSLLEVTSPLFGSAARPSVIAERSRVTLTVEGKILRVCLLKGINEGGFSGSFQNIRLDSPLAEALLGQKVGAKVEFGGKMYEVLGVE
jgi:hypothetical protein